MESNPRIGLCLGCRHSRQVPTAHAVYWRCARSATDPSFARYPRLPVLACPGFEPRGADDAPGGGGDAAEET